MSSTFAPGSSHITIAADLHIRNVEAKPNPKPIPKEKIPLAFGLLKMPKVIEDCQSSTIVVRRNALKVLCDLLKQPQNIGEAITQVPSLPVSQDLPKVLDFLCKTDDDAEVVASVSLAYLCLAKDCVGKARLVKRMKNGDCKLPSLIESTDPVVRQNAYSALLSIGSVKDGSATIVDRALTESFIEKARDEKEAVLKVLALQCLTRCLHEPAGLERALAFEQKGANTIDILLELVDSDDAEVKEGALQSLTQLCFVDEGRGKALARGAVASISSVLGHNAWFVRAAACSALMSVMTEESAKFDALKTGCVEMLAGPLVSDSNVIVVTNALKALSSVVVHPEARSTLSADEALIARLGELAESESSILARCASKARELVLWKP